MITSFGIVALLLILMGVFSLMQMSAIRAAGKTIETNAMPSLAIADSIALNITRMRVEVLRLVGNPDKLVQDQANQSIGNFEDEISKGLSQYRSLIASESDRHAIDKLTQIHKQYVSILSEVQKLVSVDRADEARAIVNSQLAPLGLQVNEQSDALQKINQDIAKQQGEYAAHNYSAAQTVVFIVIAIALVLTGLLALILTRSIVQPIGQALEIARHIAGGDLSYRIAVVGKDEPAKLLEALSTMQGNLRSTIQQISDSAHQLSASAEEMSAVMQESTQGLQRQNDQIELAATAVNEMTAAVEDVANNAISTSDASMASSQSAQQGRAQLDDAIRSIEALTGDVIGASQQAEELAEQTRNISKVLDVIRAVAEQTNLLALNAAIEAARAGDAGRGFAVVADEVRSLAHRTGESTREIETMIASIQLGTGQTVEALKSSAELANSTMSKANAAGEALNTITASVTDINDRNTLIASASEQQAQVAREVDRNLVAIRDLSIQTATGAQQTSAATQELSRLAVDLSGLVRRFELGSV